VPFPGLWKSRLMVLTETTDGVRFLRLLLPVTRSSVVVADLLFSYSISLLSFFWAWVPAMLGMPHSFTPALVDFATLLALAGIVPFCYNVLGPAAATYISLVPMCFSILLYFFSSRSHIEVNLSLYSMLLVGISICCTLVTICVTARRRYTPIDLLPTAD